MQEHIRRAHPSHYIPKLPATEESFLLMVNTPLDQRVHVDPQPTPLSARKHNDPSDRDVYVADSSPPVTPRTIDDAHPAAATAAVALAQLHHHRLASDWESEMKDGHSDHDMGRDRMRSSIELPPLRDHFKQEPLPPFQSSRPRELLPSILGHSPPGRSSTLPPLQRSKVQRPRKSSITQSARKPKHERTRSKEFGRRSSINDRKALSAEPQTAAWVQGKRWEDLIEAATSATEVDEDRELTPVPHSPSMSTLLNSSASLSSANKNRNSMPPSFQSAGLAPIHRSFQAPSYAASPLQKSLTPPPLDVHRSRDSDLEPFPSIESSLDSASTASGKNFHMSASGLPSSANSDSSPMNHLHNHVRPHHHRFSNPTPSSFRHRDIQIYCANCNRAWPLHECYACTECICGVCRDCIGMFISSPPMSMARPTSSPNKGPTSMPNYPAPRGCPRCRTVGGKWKAFQLDFR
ncbi:uncharacterized protein TRUGW13939_05987 [Talaromyces rugulosus]|uniref:RING zinc finger-like domain-containing protein n=1 Tax=Talaromyces rugulosus TaxID=121627 RepID=A0A7H8QXN5_TALRU|nr:uncharacterized protein TRUGW13939_05987 [Talaromyces rugulosus]QKX58859.1 hypothetical protein TRUGW13939_05987 [Talaromyces rugulosus]